MCECVRACVCVCVCECECRYSSSVCPDDPSTSKMMPKFFLFPVDFPFFSKTFFFVLIIFKLKKYWSRTLRCTLEKYLSCPVDHPLSNTDHVYMQTILWLLILLWLQSDQFTWTTNSNTPIIFLCTWPPVAPAIQPKYECTLCFAGFRWRCCSFHALCMSCFTECYCKQLCYFRFYVPEDQSDRMKTQDVNRRAHAQQQTVTYNDSKHIWFQNYIKS